MASQPTSLPGPSGETSRGGRKRSFLGVGLAAAWLSFITMGFAALDRHDATPGEVAAAPDRWPSETRLPHSSVGRSTLLLFVHPQCPCTRATLGELDVLLGRTSGRVDACVVFVRPPGVPQGWERTGLWARAMEIPGVTVLADDDGVEAERFGARTSGEVLLYDANGSLRFAGGITASRGHSGDNAGRDAVEDLLGGRGVTLWNTPVFGCRLLAPPCSVVDGTCRR